MDFQHGHRHQQQQQMNAGLTRYRSAPSSYFTSYLDATTDTVSGCGGSAGSGSGPGIGGYGMDDLDHFLNRFMPNSTQGQDSNLGNSFSNSTSIQSQTQFVKQEQGTMQPQQQQHQNIQNDFSQMMYQNQASARAAAEVQGQGNRNSEANNNASAIDYSNRLLSSMNSNQLPPIKMATGGGNSNLIRYNSSPAGLFANINIENEYGAMRGMENFGAGNNANAEASFSSASRFKGFSTGQSSSRLLSPISEIETKGMGGGNSSNKNFEESHRNDGGYVTGFPVNSWDDSTMLSDNFLKGLGDDDNKTFSNVTTLDNQFTDQGSEGQNNPPPTVLSRHLSLPSAPVDLSSMETLMQDSVLCKIRAKRGCATHPRSIAERVRRTRISERMRKLQELVPNMDKQTNTSDMLDLAVDYIKDLQKQVKTLADNRANCTCGDE